MPTRLVATAISEADGNRPVAYTVTVTAAAPGFLGDVVMVQRLPDSTERELNRVALPNDTDRTMATTTIRVPADLPAGETTVIIRGLLGPVGGVSGSPPFLGSEQEVSVQVGEARKRGGPPGSATVISRPGAPRAIPGPAPRRRP